MASLITCPSCASSLRIPDTVAPGSQVKCPKCQTPFTLPTEGAAAPPTPAPPPPPPPSPFSFPDDPPGALPPHRIEPGENRPVPTPPAASSPGRYDRDDDFPDEYREFGGRGGPRGLEGLSKDYVMDLGRIFQITNSHFKVLSGPMFGYAVLLFIILIGVAIVSIPCAIVPVLGPLLSNIIQTSVEVGLSAGFIVVALSQLQGKAWTFADFFKGFQWWGWLILVRLYCILLVVICYLPALIVIVAGVAVQAQGQGKFGPNGGGPPFFLLAIPVLFLGLLVFFFIWLRTGFFANALIIDRECNTVEAIQGSWMLSQGHTLQLFLLCLAILGLYMVSVLPGLGIMIAGIALAAKEVGLILLFILAGYLVVGLGVAVVMVYASTLMSVTYLVATQDRRLLVSADAKIGYDGR